MAFDLFSAGGALLGGLLNSGSSSGGTQTQTRDPWGPSQDWLKKNIASGSKLQDWYQQNPMSAQQQQAYGNQFGLSDQTRRTMPGLLGQMSSTQFFDRSQPLNRPEAYNFNPGQAGTGTSQGMQGPSNPFAATAAPQAPAVAAKPWIQPGVTNYTDGPDVAGNSFDSMNNTSALTSQIAGTLGNLGLTSLSDAIAAMNGQNFSHEGKSGGYGPTDGISLGDIASIGISDGIAAGPGGESVGVGDGNDGSSGVAWAKGGKVDRVMGPNPKGPDDGYGALKMGEFVVKKSSAKKHMGLLKDINDDGKISKKRGLLA